MLKVDRCNQQRNTPTRETGRGLRRAKAGPDCDGEERARLVVLWAERKQPSESDMVGPFLEIFDGFHGSIAGGEPVRGDSEVPAPICRFDVEWLQLRQFAFGRGPSGELRQTSFKRRTGTSRCRVALCRAGGEDNCVG